MLVFVCAVTELDESGKTKLEKIYNKYRNMMFSYAESLIKNKYDAEDIVQESLIKIAKNLKCIDDINSRETASFLIVVVKNTAYDFFRKAEHKKEMPLSFAEDVVRLDNEIENLTSRIEYEKIVSAVKFVPSPYNEVLFLHYVKDYSVKKTAAILDRKQSTVKMQLVRGKKILLEKLSEVLYE